MRYPFTIVPATPENLENATRNVVATSEEVGYDPEENTNWPVLPNEMKEQVLQRMDLITRKRLAATSKTEKEIVEREKFELNGLEVRTTGVDCRIAGYSLVGDRRVRFEFRLDCKRFTTQFQSTIQRIFRDCDVKCFFFNNFCPPNEFSSQGIAQLVPFRFERFICGENWEVNLFVLKNCVALKSVSIDALRLCGRNPETREDVFQLPVVLCAQHMECANIERAEMIHPTIQTWLERHTSMGKSIELKWSWGGTTLESFATKFEDKIIQKSDDHLLLRMKDADRQLLFHRIHVDDWISHILIKVIPVGLPESEYTTHPFNKWQYTLPRYDLIRQFLDDPRH